VRMSEDLLQFRQSEYPKIRPCAGATEPRAVGGQTVTQINRTVCCPRCAKPVRWGPESPFRPFCSERCKMTDLGAWASEEYRVAAKDIDEEPDTRSAGSEPNAT
jgi:uncharacterized protein